MAFKFDDRGFLLTRNIVDEPKNSPIVQNNIVTKEEPKPIIIKEKPSKKLIHVKSPNVIPYTRQTSNEEPQQPTGLLNRYRQYQLKKIEKKQLASDIDLLQENEKQTKLLEKIAKESGSKNSGIFGKIFSTISKLLKPLGLGAVASKIIPTSSKGNKHINGGIVKKGLKKLGIAGLIYGAFDGVLDFKDYLGLSEDAKTTLKQKITGALGGIANGFSEFVEFISMGSVKLFDKTEAFQALENITDSIESSIDGLLSEFPKTKKAIDGFTGFINNLLTTSGEGLSKLADWGKEIARTKSKAEKEFVKANNARILVETELKDGQNFFEGDDEWSKRKNELEKKLYKLKEEEYKKAKKALENSDFRANSRYNYDAVLAVQKKQVELQKKDVEKYRKWTNKKNEVQEKLTKVVSDRKAFQEQLKDKTLSDNEKKMLSLKIDSYAIAMNNLANELNEVMKKKPTVRRVEPYDLDNLSANQNINHADINKNKINTLTGKKGGSLSWRNNNVGNLMSMYDGRINPVSGKVTKSKRSYDQALRAMQKKYNGVIALDRYGSLVFDTEEHGEEAQKQLLKSKSWSKKTIEKAISAYAPSGDSNDTASYIQSVSKSIGVNKKTKLEDLTEEQFESMFLAIKKVEGYKVGTTIPTTSTAMVSKKARALTPQRNESIIAKAQTIKANQSKPIIVKQPIANQSPPQSQEVVKSKKEITEKIINKPTAPTFPQRQPIVEPRIVLNLNQESLKESI